MDKDTKKEIVRRTTELRSQLDRSSTTPRRIIYLASALQKMIDEFPKSAFPEVWEVLDQVIGQFNRVTAAEAIFGAEVLYGEFPEYDGPKREPDDVHRRGNPKIDFIRR